MIRTAGLALWLAAGPAACDSSAPTRPETFDAGQEFTLAPGGAGVARDGSFEVRFVSVSEDSRCPTDVTCVWAGEVTLKVALKARSEDAEREVKEGASTTFGGRELTVVRVRPQPVSTKKIAADEYRATFRVSASR
jgi:hypothetical protein